MQEYINAKKRYERIINDHKQNYEDNKKQIYTKFPQLKQMMIDRNNIWIDGLKNSWTDDEIDKQLNKIDQELDGILSKEGYNREILDYVPLCELCDDHGYVNGQMCQCIKQLIIDEIYKQSNLSEILSRENFDTFDESIFSTEVFSKNRSTKDHILTIKNKCEIYIDAFDRVKQNLIFAGSIGTGKTFLAHCIAKALMDRRKTVIYFTAYDLIEKFSDIAFGITDRGSMNLLWEADLVIIDDLGCERQTDFAQNLLFNMINERILRNKQMLIVTNLSTTELRETYDERIFSRFMGHFEFYPFWGADLRIERRRK